MIEIDLEVDERQKTAYYWLSKEEKTNTAFRASLEPQYDVWHKKGYKVCVFLSGEGDLLEMTKDLLRHNKEILAKRNLEERKRRERETDWER